MSHSDLLPPAPLNLIACISLPGKQVASFTSLQLHLIDLVDRKLRVILGLLLVLVDSYYVVLLPHSVMNHSYLSRK